MSPALLVVDGAVDLPEALVHAPQIRVVRSDVWMGEERFAGDSADLWRSLRAGRYPSTTPPTVSALAAAYHHRGTVVAVHVSAALSATVIRAREAAARATASAGTSVAVVDTGSLSVGAGLVATEVHRQIEAGADGPALLGRALALPDRLHTFALVQDVDALRASGRAALVPPGRLSPRRPLLLAVRGRAVALEQCRDRAAAVRRLVEHLRHGLGTPGSHRAGRWALGHGDAGDAVGIVSSLEQALGEPPAFVTVVDPTVGAHVGPGALVVGTLSTPERGWPR